MKKKLFTLCLMAIFCSLAFTAPAIAQAPTKPKEAKELKEVDPKKAPKKKKRRKTAKVKKKVYTQAITVNPVALAFNYLTVTYELRSKNKKNSYAAYFLWADYAGWGGYDLGISYRWYIKEASKYRPLEGLYAGPTVTCGYWVPSANAGQSAESGVGLTIGAEAGYKMVFEKGITFEPYVSARYMLITPDKKFFTRDKYKIPCIGVNIGYSFR